MSHGDDVLENWEEFDEAGIISTLEKVKQSSIEEQDSTTERITFSKNTTLQEASQTRQSEIAKTSMPAAAGQMKLLQRSAKTEITAAGAANTTTSDTTTIIKSPLDDMSSTFQPVMMVLHKPADEYQSANYTQATANQTVKILRRPTQSSEPRNNGIRPKQPIKTLQQREQEYAEARLRILGSAKNPEDDEKKSAATPSPTVATTTIGNSLTSTTATTTTIPPTFNNATIKINSPKIPTGTSNHFNSNYNQKQQQQIQQQQQQQQQQQLQQSQQQQQYQQHFYYSQQQQQQPSPAFNQRTYNMSNLLGQGPMGSIGQPAQYPKPMEQIRQLPQQQYHNNRTPQIQKQKNNQQQQQQQQKHQTWSPVVGGQVSSPLLRQQQQQQNDSILRMPRGPDGSTGFMRR